MSLPFPYERAPDGAEDRYRTTRPVTLHWRGAPSRYIRLIRKTVATQDGELTVDYDAPGAPVIRLHIVERFHFDVTLAPSAPAAMPGAAMHDFIYKHSALIARTLGCSVRAVLDFADHWFLALMRREKFAFSRLYFSGVSLFGYAFNRLAARRV